MNAILGISFVKRITESKFVQNTTTMLAGNVTAQVVGFIAAPLITRLYSPKDFGIMTFIQSGANIFSVMACFIYRTAIVLPKRDKNGYDLFALSLVVAVFVSFLLLLFIIPLKKIVVEKCGFAGYENYLLFIPFAVLAVSSRDIFVFLHTRLKNFRQISISTVLMSFATAGTKICAGILLPATAFWLILGNIVGPIVSSIILVIFLTDVLPQIRDIVTLAGIKDVARKYNKFPRYNMPTAFINAISQNLPVFLFGYFFSQEVVGLYGLANMILRRPVNLMSQAISKIFLQKSAEIENKGGEQYNNLKKTTLGLALIGIIPFAALTISGKWIFGFIFGKEWCEAGLYAQALAPWLFLAFVNPPANQIYIIKQKLRFLWYFNCVYIIFRFVAIVSGYYIFQKAFPVIVLFSITGIIMNLFFILHAFYLAGRVQINGT